MATRNLHGSWLVNDEGAALGAGRLWSEADSANRRMT